MCPAACAAAWGSASFWSACSWARRQALSARRSSLSVSSHCPTLLRRGYDKSLACGTICASGTLGQLIPPSTILILLADILGEFVGTLFAAAVLPGLLLSAIFCIWIIAVGIIWPKKVPPIPLEERQALPRRELLAKVLKVGLPPIALVVSVLGSIIGGIAAPTEAASMGAIGSIFVAAIAGRLTFSTLVDTANTTARITAMMFFILICPRRSSHSHSAASAASALSTICSAWSRAA